MRLIDADAVRLALIYEGQDNSAKYGFKWNDIIRFTPSEVEEIIDRRVLTVEPKKKTGKWIRIVKGERGYSAGDFRCSECGGANMCYCLTDYCCNCGAKLEKGAEQE